MINIFHKNYSEKPTVISVPLDSASSIAKLTVKFSAKQKQEQLIKSAIKHVKE